MKILTLIVVSLVLIFTDIMTKLHDVFLHILNNFSNVYKIILIAIIGGGVDYLATIKKTGEAISFRKILIYLGISGFAGFLTGNLCTYFKVEQDLQWFFVGISGYAGVRAMDFFEGMTEKFVNKLSRLKLQIEPEKEDPKEEEKQDGQQ